MHPLSTVMHWSHHLHESMTFLRHEVGVHLRSRHFWAGVAVTMLIVGFIALIVYLARNTPADTLWPSTTYGFPYGM